VRHKTPVFALENNTSLYRFEAKGKQGSSEIKGLRFKQIHRWRFRWEFPVWRRSNRLSPECSGRVFIAQVFRTRLGQLRDKIRRFTSEDLFIYWLGRNCLCGGGVSKNHVFNSTFIIVWRQVISVSVWNFRGCKYELSPGGSKSVTYFPLCNAPAKWTPSYTADAL
jgi:hypothetical protein